MVMARMMRNWTLMGFGIACPEVFAAIALARVSEFASLPPPYPT